MANPRPIYILDGPNRDINTDFSNAFLTKIGNKRKKEYIPIAITTSQASYMEHQVFPLNTWLMDLVRFDNGAWYCWFLEANTRFLIVVEGNGQTITTDAWEEFSARVPSEFFLEAFKTFQALNKIPTSNRKTRKGEKRKPVSLIIGDSEKAFWSARMLAYYNQQHIRYERINTKSEGHIRLSILDRSVRTIRDMLYRLDISNVGPDDLYRAVVIYNNTIHRTLGYTPLQVHCNQVLERRVLQRLKTDNWITTHRTDYQIGEGEEVAVRQKYKPFEKHRSTVKKGKYTVSNRNKDGSYEVRDSESKRSKVYRRDLKPIRKRS